MCYIIGNKFDIVWKLNIVSNYKVWQHKIFSLREREESYMKLISFAIPSYNSQDYMANAIESVLKGGDEIEIIIVNDGSKDDTSKIAHEYAQEYPDIIRVVDQENGGHGSAVNTGLANATAKYFKVVDSDDWVNEEALNVILDTIRKFESENQELDMILANYVYEKVGAKKKKVIRYTNFLPENKVFGWKDLGLFMPGQYILMHSVIYRTELLKLCQLKLPKHTFYVDNIFVYYPLPYVRKMYYINTDFYRYYIGRDDQSINEKNMIARVDQQVFVTKSMIDMYELKSVDPAKLRRYMRSYLAIMMTVSSIILIRSKSEENLEKKRELWTYLRKKDMRTFLYIRHSVMGESMNLPGDAGRKISVLGYTLMRRIFGFN